MGEEIDGNTILARALKNQVKIRKNFSKILAIPYQV